MANHKRKLHHVLRLIRRINYFVLLALCIFFGVTAVIALRSNNQQMVKLRTAVFTADEKNGNIEEALRNLREFVYAHMNTNLDSGANSVKPPIQLKYQYERLVAANNAAYQAETAKALEEAQSVCVARYPGTVFNNTRISCAKEYAAAHPVTQKIVAEDMYKFDFVSPRWSPDLAGWSIVASGFFLLLFVLRFLSTWAIKRELQS